MVEVRDCGVRSKVFLRDSTVAISWVVLDDVPMTDPKTRNKCLRRRSREATVLEDVPVVVVDMTWAMSWSI